MGDGVRSGVGESGWGRGGGAVADVGSNPSINNPDRARASAGTCGWKTVSAAVVVVFCLSCNGPMLIAPDTHSHSSATAGSTFLLLTAACGCVDCCC